MTQLDLFNYFVGNIKYAFIVACIAFPLLMLARSFFKK